MTDTPGYNVVVAPEKNLTIKVWDKTPAEVISDSPTPAVTTVWTGSRGARGDAGPAGRAFSYDAIDLLANRFSYDAAVEGYTFLASDTDEVYIKNSATSADWSDPITLIEIAVGDTGASAVWQAKNAAETAQAAAETAETNAETAESGAVTAQGLAEDARDAAQTAETNAETAETNAASSASAAATSETNAGTSETNAAASETKAQEWAENPEDDPVETGKFSALHWSAKAEAYRDEVFGLVPDPGTTQNFLKGDGVDSYELRTATQFRNDLGLGTAALEADTKYAHRANNLSDLANAATSRTNLGLGTAAQADLTTSATDTTAGRALKVGDNINFYGLRDFGTYYDPTANQNIDNVGAGDVGLYSTSNPGTWPAGSGTFLWVTTQRNYSSYAVWQVAVNYTSGASADPRLFHRVRANDGTWGPWSEFASLGNAQTWTALQTFNSMPLVGSSPIVESGSNSDGDWTRFADGTQICTSPLFSGAADDIGGGSYGNPWSTANFNWYYPVLFNATPVPADRSWVGSNNNDVCKTNIWGADADNITFRIVMLSDGVVGETANTQLQATGTYS